MRKIGFLATLLSICLVSTTFGHLAEYDAQSMAYGDAAITLQHDDTGQAYEDQKGQWILQITNTGIDAWTDFHFQIAFGDAIFENPGGYPVMVDGEGLASPSDIDRPSPVPPISRLVVKKGSVIRCKRSSSIPHPSSRISKTTIPDDIFAKVRRTMA